VKKVKGWRQYEFGIWKAAGRKKQINSI